MRNGTCICSSKVPFYVDGQTLYGETMAFTNQLAISKTKQKQNTFSREEASLPVQVGFLMSFDSRATGSGVSSTIKQNIFVIK